MTENFAKFRNDNRDTTASSKEALSSQIVRVRNIAQRRLASLSKEDPSGCKEAYLMHKEHFCGLRITLGAFRAVWRIDEISVQFFRGETALGQVELDGESRRAA